MVSTVSSRGSRAAAIAGLFSAAGLVLVAGCSVEVSGPTEQEARDLGRSYGEQLVDTLGDHTTPGELETLCGQGAVEEGLVAEESDGASDGASDGGGDGGGLQADAFIAACVEAVSAP
jgi:hypothetical protein